MGDDGWVWQRCCVLCILRHLGIQQILAYSWARPAILVAGKGKGGLPEMILFLLFLHFHSCSFFFPVPLFHHHYCLFYLFSPFLWETTQNDPQGLMCRLTPTQSIKSKSNDHWEKWTHSQNWNSWSTSIFWARQARVN